ncbi:MAG: hypothetical protein FJ253_00470 [Phycisphaerae bacterium]|nr:hypothetical protein [Phycisphaerae bacterium]
MNPAALAAKLRAIMASRASAAPPDAAELAQRWASLLGDAHLRLDRAVAWAQKGLRSEAAELVRAAPSVYETAAAAWDPSLAGWDDYCVRHRLPRAPLLPRESVDRLNACHLELEPLLGALARWRKLNIGRAAATERLDQMRTLRRLDPNGTPWVDDAPSLERAALAEALEASERALALWEIDRVWTVIRWIEAGEWISAPAEAAAAALRERVRELSGRSALERAKEVVQRLHAEYMAESVDLAEERLREWEALRSFLAESGVEPPRELDETVQPVVEWLRERQEASQRLLEHRTSVAELAALVESPSVTLAALAALVDRVERGPEPASPALLSAARRRVRSLTRARLARRSLVVLAGVAAASILLVSAFVLVERQARRDAAQQFLLRIDRSIAAGDLDGLDALVDRAMEEDPRLATGDAPSEARRRIAQARAQRQRDDAAFDAGLDAAGDPTRADATDELLAPLEVLARTAEQRERLELWRERRRGAEQARAAARDAAFNAALVEIEAALVRAASLGDSPAALELPAIRGRLEELVATPGVSAPALARARPALVRLESLEQALAQRREFALARARESTEIDAMLPLLRDASAYAEALRRFGQAHPDSPQSEGFLDAAIDEPSWRAVLAWPQARRAVGRSLLDLDDEQRAEARRSLREYAASHPRSVHAFAAALALEHTEPANEWRRWLAGVLDSSPLLSLRQVSMRNGDRWYYEETQAPQPTTDGARVYRIVKRLKDPAKGLFDTEFIRLEPREIVSDGESPQRVLAKALRAALRDNSLNGADGLVASIERVRDATGVNAALRAELLVGLLERLRKASPALAPALENAERRLADFDAGSLEWLDPRSTEATERSREIDAALPRLIETARWSNLRRTKAAEADAELARAYEPVGMLVADGDALVLKSPATPSVGDLLVIRSAGEGGAAGDRGSNGAAGALGGASVAADRAVVVGRAIAVADGSIRVELDSAALEQFPPGTPVLQQRAGAPSVSTREPP